MKKISIFFCIFFLLATANVFAQSVNIGKNTKPNFSGTWELDKENSDFSYSNIVENYILEIEHNEPEFKIIHKLTIIKRREPTIETELRSHNIVFYTDKRGEVNAFGPKCEGENISAKSKTRWKKDKLFIRITAKCDGLTHKRWDIEERFSLLQDKNNLQYKIDTAYEQRSDSFGGTFSMPQIIEKFIFRKQTK